MFKQFEPAAGFTRGKDQSQGPMLGGKKAKPQATALGMTGGPTQKSGGMAGILPRFGLKKKKALPGGPAQFGKNTGTGFAP